MPEEASGSARDRRQWSATLYRGDCTAAATAAEATLDSSATSSRSSIWKDIELRVLWFSSLKKSSSEEELLTREKPPSATKSAPQLAKAKEHLLWTSRSLQRPFLATCWSEASRHKKKGQNGGHKRMVLEPKFADYGTIHSMGENAPQSNLYPSHALLSPRSVLSPVDDEEAPHSSKKAAMTQGDLYQRQPLLPTPAKSDKWGHGSHLKSTEEYYVEEDEDEILHKSGDSNGETKINIPLSSSNREEPGYPQERWKTVIAAIIMFLNFVFTLASLAMVHEKVPDRNTYGPLPDIFLDTVPALDWALDVSEYIIIISVNSCLLSILLHRHRFIVFRRIFLIMSLLYMYRGITMYVTVMPVASKTYYCSPKTNETTPYLVIKRIIILFSGMGLSVNGKHTYCGDYIYSGHTVILVLSYLFISEYTPKKLYPIHWLYWALGVVGVFMLQLAHGHYTVDVIIAYFVTTRIFWTYHTLANNASLKQHSPNNYLGREWWFSFFLYFEGNVGGPVPRQWPDWPLPWPRRFHSKSRES